MRRHTVVPAAVAIWGTLVSCAGGPAPGRELTQSEQVRVDQAEQRLIRRCMNGDGFRYWVDPPASPDTVRAFTGEFVKDDIAWAREHGYGERLKQAFFEAKERDRNAAYREGLAPGDRERYSAALGGGPEAPVLSVRLPGGGSVRTLDGGCRHAAREELYGDTAKFFRVDKIAANLVAGYLADAMRDPRFTAALDGWSRCMQAETGHRYANPDAARADARDRAGALDRGRAHAVEVETAVAEATCAHRSSLAETLSRLDREYGDPVRTRYADEIATGNRMKTAALQRADRVDDDG
jgi:hypothetical protein